MVNNQLKYIYIYIKKGFLSRRKNIFKKKTDQPGFCLS